jgi:DNA invertase Pin-like site-specific DNA recombinase
VELISFREAIDTTQALGKAITVILGAIAELERNLIIERVRAGMRRARMEGRRLGRPPLEVNREAVLRDRERGMSIIQPARQHGIAETSVRRLLEHHGPTPPKGLQEPDLQLHQNKEPLSAV